MFYLFIANCINRTTVSPSRCLGIVFIHDVLPRSLNRQNGIALVMKPFQKGYLSSGIPWKMWIDPTGWWFENMVKW